MISRLAVVGTLWSTVAMARSGRRTVRPARRSPSKACGEVTSCSRCRSMYSSAGSPSGATTTCDSQTFSKIVFAACDMIVYFPNPRSNSYCDDLPSPQRLKPDLFVTIYVRAEARTIHPKARGLSQNRVHELFPL